MGMLLLYTVARMCTKTQKIGIRMCEGNCSITFPLWRLCPLWEAEGVNSKDGYQSIDRKLQLYCQRSFISAG